jgi:hypothetical protein
MYQEPVLARPGHSFRWLVDGIRVNNQWRLVFRWDATREEAEGVYLDDHSYR